MDYFRIGLFLRPHGIKGELKLLPLTDDLKRFARLSDAFIEAPEGGAFVEEIGYYNPLTDPEQVVVDGDKAKQWIKNGAQPTETVRGLFKKHGVID